MDNIIICNYQLFDMKQNIVVFKNGKQITEKLCDSNNIEKEIAFMCYKYDVPKVHLYGSENFLNHLSKQIREQSVYTFGAENKIKVEVN